MPTFIWFLIILVGMYFSKQCTLLIISPICSSFLTKIHFFSKCLYCTKCLLSIDVVLFSLRVYLIFKYFSMNKVLHYLNFGDYFPFFPFYSYVFSYIFIVEVVFGTLDIFDLKLRGRKIGSRFIFFFRNKTSISRGFDNLRNNCTRHTNKLDLNLVCFRRPPYSIFFFNRLHHEKTCNIISRSLFDRDLDFFSFSDTFQILGIDLTCWSFELY